MLERVVRKNVNIGCTQCAGFGDVSEKEVQNLDGYCLEHNKQAQIMRQAVIET